jgi:hypothetical protein
MDDTKYHINPNVVWVDEPPGQIKVLPNAFDDPFYLRGIDAILWRSIWQGFPIVIWRQLALEEGKAIHEIIQRWIASGLIEEGKK